MLNAKGSTMVALFGLSFPDTLSKRGFAGDRIMVEARRGECVYIYKGK